MPSDECHNILCLMITQKGVTNIMIGSPFWTEYIIVASKASHWHGLLHCVLLPCLYNTPPYLSVYHVFPIVTCPIMMVEGWTVGQCIGPRQTPKSLEDFHNQSEMRWKIMFFISTSQVYSIGFCIYKNYKLPSVGNNNKIAYLSGGYWKSALYFQCRHFHYILICTPGPSTA